MNYFKNKENYIAQVEVNPGFSENPDYSVPNPVSGVSGESLAIIMAMTIFCCVVKKLVV